MRPVARKSTFQQKPLDYMLGRETQVRILRVLALEDGPFRIVDLATRTSLTVPGTRLAVQHLERTGLIEAIGQGGQRQYALRKNDPMSESLHRLFATEKERYDGII